MYKCAHVCTRDQVNNCGINGGLALPESSPVLPIIGGTSVCLHLTLLHFGAVTGTLTILVITLLQYLCSYVTKCARTFWHILNTTLLLNVIEI